MTLKINLSQEEYSNLDESNKYFVDTINKILEQEENGAKQNGKSNISK